MMRSSVWVLALCLFISGCRGNPYLEQSLKPAELQGKDKAWFLKNWGDPSGKAPRFFGGETWTLLPRHLFLERRCTTLAAETIRLSSDDLGHR